MSQKQYFFSTNCFNQLMVPVEISDEMPKGAHVSELPPINFTFFAPLHRWNITSRRGAISKPAASKPHYHKNSYCKAPKKLSTTLINLLALILSSMCEQFEFISISFTGHVFTTRRCCYMWKLSTLCSIVVQ